MNMNMRRAVVKPRKAVELREIERLRRPVV
jgi:hypothetical protein